MILTSYYLYCTVLGYIQTLCVSKGSVIAMADWNSQGWDLPAGIEQLLRHSSCCLPKINSKGKVIFPFALTNTRPIRTDCVTLWLLLPFDLRDRNRWNATGRADLKRECRVWKEQTVQSVEKRTSGWYIRGRQNKRGETHAQTRKGRSHIRAYFCLGNTLTHCWLSNMKMTNHTSSQDWAWQRVRLI